MCVSWAEFCRELYIDLAMSFRMLDIFTTSNSVPSPARPSVWLGFQTFRSAPFTAPANPEPAPGDK